MNPGAYTEMQELEDSHWWFTARRQIISDFIAQSSSAPCKILEVGCGTGGNLSMLSQFGELKAFEMNPDALAMANQKGVKGATLTLGRCPDQMPYQGEKFDLICMFDVLEHIQNDSLALIELKKYLSPRGKMIVAVPAYQWLFGPHDQFRQHERRYSMASLKKVIEQSGLHIQRMSYFNTLLFPLALVSRLLDRLIHSKEQNKVSNPNPLINQILCNTFAAERHLLRIGNLPMGLSLICVLSV